MLRENISYKTIFIISLLCSFAIFSFTTNIYAKKKSSYRKSAKSKKTFQISGVVFEAKGGRGGGVVPKATVKLEGYGSTTCNIRGEYSFNDVPFGRHRINASKKGYKSVYPKGIPFTVNEPKNLVLNIRLKKNNISGNASNSGTRATGSNRPAFIDNDTDIFISRTSVPRKIGKSLTILGKGFGNDKGRVRIMLKTGRPSFMTYCPIQQWRDNNIRITIPDKLQEYDDKKNEQWILWVNLSGRNSGPYIDLDLEGWEPVIKSLSTEELAFGEQLIIEGDYFLKQYTSGYNRSGVGFFYQTPGYTHVYGGLKLVSWSYNRIIVEVKYPISERKRYFVEVKTGAGGRTVADDPIYLVPE